MAPSCYDGVMKSRPIRRAALFAAVLLSVGCRTSPPDLGARIPLERRLARALPGGVFERPHPGAALVRANAGAGDAIEVLAFDLRRADLEIRPAVPRANAADGAPGGEPLVSLRLRSGGWAAVSGGAPDIVGPGLSVAVIDGVASSSDSAALWGFAVRNDGRAEIRPAAAPGDRHFLPAEALLLLRGRPSGRGADSEARFRTAWARTAICTTTSPSTAYWVDARRPGATSGETLDAFVRRLRAIGCRDALLTGENSYAGLDVGLNAFTRPNDSPIAFAWIAKIRSGTPPETASAAHE